MGLKTLDFPDVCQSRFTLTLKAEVVDKYKLERGDIVTLLGHLVRIDNLEPTFDMSEYTMTASSAL